MGGVGGVLHDAVGFAGASCKENVQDGWERGTDDLCSRVHCPLEGLAVSSTAVPVPDSDAAGQHTLNGAPVERGEDGWWETCSFPCCLCTFSYPISSFQSTLHLICFDTALCKQPHLSVMTFCDLPSLWRVSMFVFWIIAKSAVFPIIVVSENKRYQ